MAATLLVAVPLAAVIAIFGRDTGGDSDLHASNSVVTRGDGPAGENGDADRQPVLKGSLTDTLVLAEQQQHEHPLDPLLEMARLGMRHLEENVADYTATMIKAERERLGSRLREEQMEIKVRHRQEANGERVPFSVYVRHTAPASVAGQEAIWVEDWHNGRLVAHTTGLLGFRRFYLDPTSVLAMRGNRYPITEIGKLNLILRMIEKGHRDRNISICQVEYDRDIEFDGRSATMIRVTHPEPHPDLEFHIAVIYIDDTRDIPVGYESYLWPEQPGGEPVLMERYFYRDVQLNVGLTDRDFDPDNPAYGFP